MQDYGKRKRKKGQHDENYLASSSFADELHRSFHEIIAIIVSTLGYLPLRVHFNEEK